MKNNISLSTLDEFAKRISSKQVNMLYENRMHKKYSKKVFESSSDIFADNFCLYVTKTAYEPVFLQAELISDVADNVSDCNYKVTETGIYFYTELPDAYDLLKKYFETKNIEYSDVTNLD